jgi:hypothetical protein
MRSHFQAVTSRTLWGYEPFLLLAGVNIEDRHIAVAVDVDEAVVVWARTPGRERPFDE